MQQKIWKKQKYYFKGIENRAEEWRLCSKLQKKHVEWSDIYGTLLGLSSAPMYIQPVLWMKQSDEKMTYHYVIKVCSIIQIHKGRN